MDIWTDGWKMDEHDFRGPSTNDWAQNKTRPLRLLHFLLAIAQKLFCK